MTGPEKEALEVLMPFLGEELAKDVVGYEEVAQLLTYDPGTGKLYWKQREEASFKRPQDAKAWMKKYAGREAFTASSGPYLQGTIFGRRYIAHRVCWLLQYGTWPTACIDHLDGDGRNNRIANLRDVSQGLNSRNSSIRQDNTSGFPGVRWEPRSKKWTARINVSGQEKHLGCFQTIEEAAAARKGAGRVLGYTDRHVGYSKGSGQ